MSVNPDVQEIIEYLESNDLEIVNHFKNTVQEKLYASRDHTLLGTLTDRYIQTRSDRLLEILIAVNDTHAMHLFERLNDHLRHGAHIEVCTLLFSIVRKQPSWLHKLVGTSLFATFLKYLKNDSDFVFVMNGLIILCTLLPCVPTIISSHHGDILEVFVRTAGMLLNKSGQIPEVCILHLHISVYILFHRLYSMYPNNFLSYMRSCFGTRKKDPVFLLIIKPMFEFVKFHPDLITETPKSETSLGKWKVLQPHDVLVDCQRVSLDPVDSIKEGALAIARLQPNYDESPINQNRENNTFFALNSVFARPELSSCTSPQRTFHDNTSIDNKSLLPDIPSLCNPSEICGMTTPPSSRPISPSNSLQDIPNLPHASRLINTIDFRGSTHTLNELNSERKHSGQSETASICSNQSPVTKRQQVKKTKSFGSSDNINTKLRSWLPGSATHSTPAEKIDKELVHSQISAPTTSPRKMQVKRPKSTEFFKYTMAKHLSLTSSDIHSAPVSPMIHTSTTSTPANQFSFNVTGEGEHNISDEQNIHKKHSLPAPTLETKHHPILHTTQSTPTSLPTNSTTSTHDHVELSSQLLRSITDMFAELCPKLQKETTDASEGIDTSIHHGLRQQKQKSPLYLLDEFIQYGSEIHSLQLKSVPIPSQLDTDWSHYGGQAPADELKILQRQVYLLHTQLLYERYKCELHCLRNRRLFGSLQKSQVNQYELNAMKDQIILNEKKFNEIRLNIRHKTDENRKLQQQIATKEHEFSMKIKELERNTKELEYKLKNTKYKKKELKLNFGKTQKELHKAKHLLHETMHQVLKNEPKIKEVDKLNQKIESLQKELIVQSEKQERVKAYVLDYGLRNFKHKEQELLLDSHRRELRALQEENDLIQTNKEQLKVRICELEGSNTNKEKLIREHKSELSMVQARHKKELEVLEERLRSSQKTCQTLNSYVVRLYAKLEEVKSNTSTTQSSHHHNHHHHHHHTNVEKVRKSASYAGLDFIHENNSKTSSHHASHHHFDQSHRHPAHQSIHLNTPRDHDIDGGENPFRIRSHTSSISSVSDALKRQNIENQDSGIVEQYSNEILTTSESSCAS